MQILSIDQGTTNTKAAVVDAKGSILASATCRMQSHYPQPGWVEQSASDIWDSTMEVIAALVRENPALQIDAIAIANQRETTVCWDAETSEPLCPAITWQCSRAADICDQIEASGSAEEIRILTGLALSPYFPAAKAAWILKNVPEAHVLAGKGRLRFGTVDTWLLWQLTDGRSYKTDFTNASRTQLFDTKALTWSSKLCEIFNVPQSALPEVVASDAEFGLVAEKSVSLTPGLPICAMLGDSHAALFGHGVSAAGQAKATYGTGTSVMAISKERALSHNKISSTIAYAMGEQIQYALEGNINVSGQAAQFVTKLLGLRDPAHLSKLAQSVENSGGVVFVPALAGLGAPHWDHSAKGMFAGLTHSTTTAHLARATLEAICLQVDDILRAMARDMGQKIDTLFVDGGGSSNDFLMQMQADISDISIVRGEVEEVGAVGTARLAASHAPQPVNGVAPKFTPHFSAEKRDALLNNWQAAVQGAIATKLQQ